MLVKVPELDQGIVQHVRRCGLVMSEYVVNTLGGKVKISTGHMWF